MNLAKIFLIFTLTALNSGHAFSANCASPITGVSPPCDLSTTDVTISNTGSITGSAGGDGGSVNPSGIGGNGGAAAAAISNAVASPMLTNSGTITGGDAGSGGNVTSSGIGGNGGAAAAGITVSGTITTLTNSGTITGGDAGNGGNVIGSGIGGNGGAAAAGITVSGTITTLTNSGTITGGTAGSGGSGAGIPGNGGAAELAGIRVTTGTIGTLNNLQGASSNALRYRGVLPTSYNIIVNSPSDFGKLLASGGVSGVTAFGISSLSAGASIISTAPYSAVLDGITNTQLGITGTSQAGTSNGYTYLLSTAGGNIWDLIISAFAQGPSAADTQSSIQTLAGKLRSIFNASAISSNFANMNTYDCNLFDAKGMCISAGGRYTTVDSPNSNSTSAVVVVGYKATPNIRVGGFLDQNINNNTPSGINISNKNPLMGAFVVWNQNQDGLGYQVKLANAYQDKNVDTTREVIGTSEAGKGTTDLTTQSYVGELSYAFNYNDKTLLRPYLALRHTMIKQDAYTETGVATPLSYDSLEDRSTTALLGLKLNHQLTPKTTLTASLGIEQDLEHSVDDYSATSTGISGLTSENFNDSIKRTRPVASAGAYYAVSKTQRIAGDIYYQQLPFQSTGSTTAYFNYTIGF